ncbi:MAG TPA: hypothetical protein VGF85_00240 [Opitutaceae bacterium]
MRALGLLAAVSVLAVRADDRPVTPDALSTAKSDLASLKAVASEAASASSQPLRIETQSPAPGGAPTTGAEPAKDSGNNPNWLLDAMLKPSERVPVFLDGTDALGRELDLRSAASENPGNAPIGARPAADAAPSRLAVVNPLEAFMDGWISAHDRELLRPAKAADPLLEGFGAGGVDLASRPDDPAAKEPANPYLANLEAAIALPIPEGPLLNPLTAPDFAKPNSLVGPEAKPFEGPRIDLPDFSNPEADDKYFKQMKRF